MIPREHLATWLGVSEGRVSQMMHSLMNTWGLIARRGKRGEVRYALSDEGIRYVTHRDRAELPTTRGIWSTELTTDKEGRLRHVGAGLPPTGAVRHGFLHLRLAVPPDAFESCRGVLLGGET